jgi:hypothetical protein
VTGSSMAYVLKTWKFFASEVIENIAYLLYMNFILKVSIIETLV